MPSMSEILAEEDARRGENYTPAAISSSQPSQLSSALSPAPPPAATPVSYPGPPSEGPTPGLSGALSISQAPTAARPAGFIPTARTEKTAVSYSPETVKAVGDYLDSQTDVAKAQIEAENKRAIVGTKMAQAASLYDEASAAKAQLRADRQRAATSDYIRQKDNLLKDASSDREDPYKFFHDMPTGSQILTGLAMAVSGFGFGYSGRGVNPVDWFNQQIRQSVDSQRQAHAKKLETVEGMRTSYQELRQQWGDDEKTALASEAAQRQVLMGHLQANMADVTAPAENRLRASQIYAGLADTQQKTLREMDEKAATSIERSEHYREATGAGPGTPYLEYRMPNGRTVKLTIGQAKEAGMLPESQLKALETESNIGKTQAETAKLRGETGKAGILTEAGKEVTKAGSTAILEHPLDYLLSPYQGTKGYEKAERREQYNALLLQKMPGKSPESRREFAKGYLIEPGMTEETIRNRVEAASRYLSGQPGQQEQMGEGAVEQ